MKICGDCIYYDYCYSEYDDYYSNCILGDDKDFLKLENGEHIKL